MRKFSLLILSLVYLSVMQAQVNIPDIATLRTQTADNSTVYCLTNEVLLTHQQSFRNQKVIQDGTAGILIDDPSGIITSTYNIGDGITGICGTLYYYAGGGFLEFIPTQDPGLPTSSSNAIIPVEITINEFNNNFDDYRYEIVKINGVTFDDAGASFQNGTSYVIRNGSNTSTFFTYIWNVDYIGTEIPSQIQNIVGIAAVKNAGTVKYIVARDKNDFSTVYPAPISSTSIFIAIGLVMTFIVIRFRHLFF